MFKTYKYISKLHRVINENKSIIHLLSVTCTSLDSLKKDKKYILKNLLECI